MIGRTGGLEEQMGTQYKTNISDRKWIAYDIPGNIGWIAYLVCVVKMIREKRDAYHIAALLPAGIMLIGVAELISERIVGLDRILSGRRLFRGFGALTAGGLLGLPIAAAGFRKNRKRAWIMLAGSVLCSVFAGLLLAGYRKMEKE